MAGKWSFRLLLWYICILCVQPQNRFLFLYPLHIADISIMGAAALHFLAASQEGRPFLRFGPATIIGILLMFFSLCSLYMGPMQTNSAWNSDIDIIYKNCFVMILVEAMAFTPQRVWAVQSSILFSTLWWVKGGLRLSAAGATYSGDRLMGPAVSLIENPNGFAYLMTLMLPLYLYFYQKAPHRMLRYGFLGLALAAVYIILQTGSRTGLLALFAVGAFLLPKYGREHKSTLVVATLVIIVFSTSIGALNVERFKSIPESIKSFFSGEEEDADPTQMTQDQQSAWERKMKNKHTLALIMAYPVFGVGIQADDALMWDEFPFAVGQVHNEILYAGKQMGFIGMGLYLALLFTLYRSGARAQREARYTWPVLADLGWTFKMMAVVIAVGGFFSPIPWNAVYLVIVGSASALWYNMKTEGATGAVAAMPAGQQAGG